MPLTIYFTIYLTIYLTMSLTIPLIIELYICALGAIYWLSLRAPQVIALSVTTALLSASTSPQSFIEHATAAPTLELTRDDRRGERLDHGTSSAPKRSSSPRCWVGVIDQINPPWISVAGEYGEELELSLDRAYPEVQEGDWVIYWDESQRLEPLRSREAQRETERLRREVYRLLSQPYGDLSI